MFKNKTTDEHPELAKAIDEALSELKSHEPNSAQYAAIVEQLEKLYALKPKKSPPISKDTVLAVAGNLTGIVLILSYEHAYPVVSKALGFVIKSKV